MAIAFARATLIRLTRLSDATRIVAYVARTRLRAIGPRGVYDYRHLRSDLIYEKVILPANARTAFRRTRVFANAIDQREILKLRTPLSERIRPPQLALAVVVALPPSTEAALHEAIEVMHRIVIKARGSHELPIHVAIHHKKINRHGHATIAFRPIHPDGTLGLKTRDQFATFRTTAWWNAADVVEGLNWPKLTWEVHATFFAERAIDLVVDPAAPKPGEHLAAYAFNNGEFHDGEALRRIHADRRRLQEDNIEIIRGSPPVLIEALLRGRSVMQIDEVRRLCARFVDAEGQRHAAVDRLLIDQNVITSADDIHALNARYVTTRRVERLMKRAIGLLERSPDEFRAFTGPDHPTVVAQITESVATDRSPLILGLTLSDCDEIKSALAHLEPVTGTIDMAVTAPAGRRTRSKRRGVCVRPGRLVIVPRSERVDDQRLARLLVAASSLGVKLVLGHDQGRETGIVCSHLAALIADCWAEPHLSHEGDANAAAIVRMMKAGLIQRAVKAMVGSDLVVFGSRPIKVGDEDYFVVCDDPRRVPEANEAARNEQVRAGKIEEPQTLTGPVGERVFALGEWVVATRDTAAQEGDAGLEAHQVARIVAIDSNNCWVDVFRNRRVDRVDLSYALPIRPAAAISIRQAWDVPPNAELDIEIGAFRNVWAALALGASRIGRTRIFVDPTVAQNAEELADAARRSIPGCPPHLRTIRRDTDANLNKVFWEIFPQFAPSPPVVLPPVMGLAEELRKRLAGHSGRLRTYELLCKYVAPDNPNRRQNLDVVLNWSHGALTKALIRLMAEGVLHVPRSDLDELDMPAALSELAPDASSETDLVLFERDLDAMTLPHVGPLWQPVKRPHLRQLLSTSDDPESPVL
jgi:hypothetical protein